MDFVAAGAQGFRPARSGSRSSPRADWEKDLDLVGAYPDGLVFEYTKAAGAFLGRAQVTEEQFASVQRYTLNLPNDREAYAREFQSYSAQFEDPHERAYLYAQEIPYLNLYEDASSHTLISVYTTKELTEEFIRRFATGSRRIVAERAA